jgi:hypothetical protein
MTAVDATATMSRAPSATLVTPRLPVPPSTTAPARTAHPDEAAPVVIVDRENARWPWYRHVTVVLLALATLAIVYVGVQRPGRDTAPSAQPITEPAELQATGQRALALVAYPWRQLSYQVVFAPGRANVRGQTNRQTKTITVFLTRGDAPHRVAHDIAHEFGHAFDDQFMNDALRSRYLQARGASRAAWFPGARFSDYAFGAGDFAEVFALCHAASPEFRSQLSPRPAQPCGILSDITPEAGRSQ